MGIVLDADAVRLSTAALMAHRLRAGGFAVGRGGTATTDFTADTTPTLTRATEVATRNAALVSDDFPVAEEGDEPELRTIAALRAAIELENGLDAPNFDRIREWRLQLREHVDRVNGRGVGDGTDGARVLAAVWDFGVGACEHVPGSEEELAPLRRRRVW